MTRLLTLDSAGAAQDTQYYISVDHTPPIGTTYMVVEFSSFSGTWVNDFTVHARTAPPIEPDPCA